MLNTFRQLRLQAQLTQMEAAKKIGVTQSQISAWEHGAFNPRLVRIRPIAEAYNTDVDTITKAAQEVANRREQRRKAEIERRAADKERAEGAGMNDAR